jgi:uncharacterized membrane protein (DUF2068 family)
MREIDAVRAVALFEAAKGVLVLLAGLGSLVLLHEDVQHLAELLVGHLHLNPARRLSHLFFATAAALTEAHLRILALVAVVYAAVRFVEAWGLWRARRWAEWFAAASAGIYLPLEAYELYASATWMSLGILLINLLVVGVMLHALLHPPEDSAGCGH